MARKSKTKDELIIPGNPNASTNATGNKYSFDTQTPAPSKDPYAIPLTSELGVTGLRRFGTGLTGGYVYEEWLTELSGTQAADKYREMSDNDSTVAALIFSIKMLARGVQWDVVPGGEDELDLEAAAFLKDQNINGMEDSWHDTITEVLSEIQYGFSPHEIVYRKNDEGDVCWKKLSIRAQPTILRWQFDDQGDILGLWQLAPPFYKLTYIPEEKFLLFRTESTKNNPQGRSILRTAYKAYKYKIRLAEIEAIGLERSMAGIPLIWIPTNISNPDSTEAQASLDAFTAMGRNIRMDAQSCIVMPLAYDPDTNQKIYDIELLTTSSTADMGPVIQRYANEILQSVLADFISIGHEGTGSFALAGSKTSIFMQALDAFLDGIEEVLNNKAVPRLFALNPRFNVENLPKIRHSEVETMDLNAVANMLKVVGALGMDVFPDLNVENYLRTAMGLPLKTEDKFQEEQDQLAEEEALGQPSAEPVETTPTEGIKPPQ